jgi:isochorismate pyruvate lyase
MVLTGCASSTADERTIRHGPEALAPKRTQAAAQGFDPDIAEPMWWIMIEAIIAREEREIGTGGEDR